eukprot:11233802-Prorocentrum_lima.AAC.1
MEASGPGTATDAIGKTGGPARATRLTGESTLRGARDALNTKGQALTIKEDEYRTAIGNITTMVQRHQTGMLQDAGKFLIATS